MAAFISNLPNPLAVATEKYQTQRARDTAYQFALGQLRQATCYILGYTDPREYQWQADWLTKLAQAWVKGSGTLPPPVSCPGKG